MNSEEQVQKVQALFDDWAERGRGDGMEKGHTPTARQAFDRLEVSPDDHYLDIGCGNGYTVRWAAQLDPTVQAVGIDVSEKMIQQARTLSTELPNTRFIHAPFPLPMLKARAFDAIFSMEVFYYLPNLDWGLLSVGRLLKPGGQFACVVDYYEENEASHRWPEDLDLTLNLLSAAGWREAMEEMGFEVLEQCRLHPPLAEGEEPTWKHTVGSLMTLVRRPLDDDAIAVTQSA
jgi:ubiquinone/menaquinone biosynthesis C-methylase UbiE